MWIDISKISPRLALAVLDELRAGLAGVAPPLPPVGLKNAAPPPAAASVPGSRLVALTKLQAAELWQGCGIGARAILREIAEQGVEELDDPAIEAALKPTYNDRQWGAITKVLCGMLKDR